MNVNWAIVSLLPWHKPGGRWASWRRSSNPAAPPHLSGCQRWRREPETRNIRTSFQGMQTKITRNQLDLGFLKNRHKLLWKATFWLRWVALKNESIQLKYYQKSCKMIMSLTFINTMTGAWWVRLFRRDSSDTLADANDISAGCKDRTYIFEK